jgi:hypothetical protein
MNPEFIKDNALHAIKVVPFILICYFLLYSLLYNSISGIILLSGMCMVVLVAPLFIRTISNNGNNNINMFGSSNIPFSQIIYCFTFAYLLFTTLVYNHVSRNILSLISFIILILVDAVHQYVGTDPYIIFKSMGLGVIGGLLWGYAINSLSNKNYQYIIGNHEMCLLPKKLKGKCIVKD